MTRAVRALTVVVASVVATPVLSAEDFRVEARVSATKIGMDDALELTLTLHGDSMGRAGQPRLPKLDGFRLAGQSQSTSIQFINGQMSSTRSIVFTLLPQAEGKHVIGSVTVSYGGKDYPTDPIEVEVVSGSVAPPGGGAGGRGGIGPGNDPFGMFPFRERPKRRTEEPVEVFATAELSRSSAYVGQRLLLIYKLYTQASIAGLEIEHAPAFTGFWVEEVQLPRERPWEVATIDGKEFHVFEVKKSYLFPTKEGRITIEPATFAMAVRASVDPFDSFFYRQSDTIRRSTKPVTLDVKPVPVAGRPAGWSGAVGEFRLEAKLDKERVEAGNPVTLSVTLAGDGNVKTAEPPRLPSLVDFKTYPPKIDEKINAEREGFHAQKKWEHVLVPSSVGAQNLGSVRFSYFDPMKERFVQLETGPLSIEVERAADGAPGLTASGPRSEVKLLRRDVRYLKPAPPSLGAAKRSYYQSALFYATLGLPILWNLALIAYGWQRKREASDASTFRGRRARRLASRKLKLADRKARTGSRDFYEVASTALYSYVGDKLNVSPSGLTTAQIDGLLEDRGVPVHVRAGLLSALDACEFARFTPGDRTSRDMEETLRAAEGAIVSLEKHLQ